MKLLFSKEKGKSFYKEKLTFFEGIFTRLVRFLFNQNKCFKYLEIFKFKIPVHYS